LNDSKDITTDFLNEVACHVLFSDDSQIVKCYGISQDPNENYLMVMKYMEHGDLRKYLQNNCEKLTFRNKLSKLIDIIRGLESIHNKRLIHQDFHAGNILNNSIFDLDTNCYISDLGLCRPVNKEKKENKVYGVLPYVAPEVLKNKKYTQAADIYSFGMLVYELFSGSPPYYDLAHDEFLGLKICQGLRPDLNNIKIPQSCKTLISKC
jgi:serine/threonine protein kinase